MKNEPYSPGGALLKWVTGLMIAALVLHPVAILSSLKERDLLNRIEDARARYNSLKFRPIFADEEIVAEYNRKLRERNEAFDRLDNEVDRSNSRQRTIGASQVVLYILTAILFLRLLSRANRNARAMGARDMNFTPGWCIGWFFVPIANLFKPLMGVREIWKASIPTEGDWSKNETPALLSVWWALWIVANIAGQAAFSISGEAQELAALRNSVDASIFSDIVSIALTIVALMMIRQLYSLQQEKYELVGEQPLDQPGERADGSCRFCGEPVEALTGACPMCGEPLASSDERDGGSQPSSAPSWS